MLLHSVCERQYIEPSTHGLSPFSCALAELEEQHDAAALEREAEGVPDAVVELAHVRQQRDTAQRKLREVRNALADAQDEAENIRNDLSRLNRAIADEAANLRKIAAEYHPFCGHSAAIAESFAAEAGLIGDRAERLATRQPPMKTPDELAAEAEYRRKVAVFAAECPF